MSRVVILLPVVLFFALAGVFAYALYFKELFTGVAHNPSELPSALIDRPAPEFALPALRDDGQGLSSADLKGGGAKLVNVFASWCAPCRIEHPQLMEMAKAHGVTLHGIAYKDKPEDSRRFLEVLGDPFTRVGVDRDGRAAIDWGVYGVPETYVVDADGHIRYRHVGPLMPQDMEKMLGMVRELGR